MSQSWNAPAVRLAFDVILRRQWLAIPHYSVPDIRYINFAELKKAGCEGVVFDKDNCITNPYENNVCALVLPGWEECISVFGEKNILIMSNSVGSSDDHDFEEAIQLEKELSVRVVKHGSKKPNGHDAITEALGIGTEHLSQLAFVGDRVLTDVVFGNLKGMLTIHTQAFTAVGDNAIARRIRWIENNMLLPLFRWAGHREGLPQSHHLWRRSIQRDTPIDGSCMNE